MRSWLLGCMLAACGGSEPPGTPITITFDDALARVAVRDGDHWKQPRSTAPGVFTTDVHGPYLVAAAYSFQTHFDDGVYQLEARTPDDDPLVITDRIPAWVNVVGMAAQPGTVFLGVGNVNIPAADPPIVFWIRTLAGAEDLLGLFGDRAILQRGLVVPALPGDMALNIGPFDAAAGIPLDTVSFSATNARLEDTVTARMVFENPTFPFGTDSAFGDPSAVRVLPDGALAAGDRQSVAVCAITGDLAGAAGDQRCRQQPYHAGSSTAYTLPSLVGGVVASEQKGVVTMQWSRLDDGITGITANAWGSNDVRPAITYQFHATAAFLAASPLSDVDFAVAPILGDNAAIDFTRGYRWQFKAERAADVVDTHTVSGEVTDATPRLP